MCVFVGYKYGYGVRDPRKSVVFESTRDVIFFEDGLPPPTFRELATQADNADKPVVPQPPTNHLPFLRQ